MTGWSNENMGPVAFLTAVAAILYLIRFQKKKPAFWMWEGAAASLAGSILVIAAPGNFVRADTIEKQGILTLLWTRLYSMITAGTDYLFPSALFVIAVLFLYVFCAGGRPSISQWMLLAAAVLSFGAMVLSPHYPDRATFGTMVACIILTLSLLGDLLEKHKRLFPWAAAFTGSMWFFAVYRLLVGFFSITA